MKNREGKVTAIILAAGRGRRFGEWKQFVPLQGKPLLGWSLRRFDNHPKIDEIVLVWREGWRNNFSLSPYSKISEVVSGGERRQDSVVAGFNLINPGSTNLVLIHDSSRPLVSDELINRVIEGTHKEGATVPVIPIQDTVKQIKDNKVILTLDREFIFRVQTPQGFKYPILKEALEKAAREKFYGTDEASLVERLGKAVKTVEGECENIKVTFPQDIKVVEALIGD